MCVSSPLLLCASCSFPRDVQDLTGWVYYGADQAGQPAPSSHSVLQNCCTNQYGRWCKSSSSSRKGEKSVSFSNRSEQWNGQCCLDAFSESFNVSDTDLYGRALYCSFTENNNIHKKLLTAADGCFWIPLLSFTDLFCLHTAKSLFHTAGTQKPEVAFT